MAHQPQKVNGMPQAAIDHSTQGHQPNGWGKYKPTQTTYRAAHMGLDAAHGWTSPKATIPKKESLRKYVPTRRTHRLAARITGTHQSSKSSTETERERQGKSGGNTTVTPFPGLGSDGRRHLLTAATRQLHSWLKTLTWQTLYQTRDNTGDAHAGGWGTGGRSEGGIHEQQTKVAAPRVSTSDVLRKYMQQTCGRCISTRASATQQKPKGLQ